MSTKNTAIGPVPLLVNNQGIIFFTTENAESFTMYVSPYQDTSPIISEQQYFSLKVSGSQASFHVKLYGEDRDREVESISSTEIGIPNSISNTSVTYWLSFHTNYDHVLEKYISELKYGKGFAMEKTTLMEIKIGGENYNDLDVDCLFTYKTQKYVTVEQIGPIAEGNEPNLFINKIPVTVDPDPVITDSSTATLKDIDGTKTLSSMLPLQARKLFHTVKDLELHPDLVEAIRYSINTEGATLNKKIEEKKTESEFTSEEVYIRVTLGEDIKIGVGIPFVLELWPSGMRSPIHNHGDATAVIKVLHGEIHCDNYNKMTVPPQTYPAVEDSLYSYDCRKGAMIWMTKNYFQVHQLSNNTDDFCATIQCYLFSSGDRIHYPAFDFMEVEGSNVEQFYPDSDFKYGELCDLVLKGQSACREDQFCFGIIKMDQEMPSSRGEFKQEVYHCIRRIEAESKLLRVKVLGAGYQSQDDQNIFG